MSALWTLAASALYTLAVPLHLSDGTGIYLTRNGTSYTLSYGTDHATLHTISTWTGGSATNLAYWLAVDASDNIYVFAIDSSLSPASNGLSAQAFAKGTGYSWTAKGWMVAANPYPTYGIGNGASRPVWCNTGGGTNGAGHLVAAIRAFNGGAYEDDLVVADAGVLLQGSGTPYVGKAACGSTSGTGHAVNPAISQDGFGGTAGISLFNQIPGNGIYPWTISSAGSLTVGSVIALPTMSATAVAQWLWITSGTWALIYDSTSSPSLTVAIYTATGQAAAPVGSGTPTGWTTPAQNTWTAYVSAETANRIYVLAFSSSTVKTMLRLGCNVSPIAWDAAAVVEDTSFGTGSTYGNQGAVACVRQPVSPAVDYAAVTYDGTTYETAGSVSEPDTSVNVPTLLSPSNGDYVDVASGVTLEWQFNAADGSSQAGFCIRYKVSGAASYLYWNTSTGAGQSTPVYNSGSSQTYTLPPGAMSDGQNWNWSVSTLSNTRIESGFAADFTIVAAIGPSVNVTAPTGTVATTSYPVVTWVPTLAPNLAQTTYQVRVFSAAQAGIAGFDPATSPATWDSGQVLSSATSVTVASPLGNASGWKAYVQIIQTGGQTSAWSSTTFTVNADVPATPILTATTTTDPTTGLPYISLTLEGTDNLLSTDDASFESTLGTWGNTSNCAIARTTSHSDDGTASMQMTASASGSMSASTATGTSGYAVTANAQYTGVAAFLAGATARTVSVTISWYTSAGTHISDSAGSGVTDGTGGWTQARVTATAPSNAAFACVKVTVASAAASEVHYVDEAGIRPGSDTTWFRGGLLGLTTAAILRSDGLYVRGASTANMATLPASGETVTLPDAEVVPTLGYTYTAVVTATPSAGQTVASASSAATAQTTLTTTQWWEFDPTDLTTAVAAQPTEFNPQITEQSAAHLVMGQPTPNVIANAMGATDGSATFETFDMASYTGLATLLQSQKTVFLSNPFGNPYGVLYARFGPQTGGMSGGAGNKVKDARLHPSTASAPHHELSVNWVAQPRPAV